MTKDSIRNALLELPGGLAQVHSILCDIDPAHSDIIMVSLNKALLGRYFLGGWPWGGALRFP